MVKILGLVSVFGLMACGQASGDAAQEVLVPKVEPKEVVKEPVKGVVPAYSVTSSSELPACESAINGQLIFTESDGKFQYCRNNTWTVIQDEEEEAQQLVTGQYGLSLEDFCVATSLEVYSQQCYLKSGEIVTLADGSAFYSLVVHQNKIFDDGDSDSDSHTISGFTKVVNNKVAIDIGLFYGLSSQEYVTHWMSITLGVSAFILEDSNDSGDIENTDTVAASFEVFEIDM